MAHEDSKLTAILRELTDAAERPEGARNALAMLFPKAEEVLETYVPSDELDAFGRIRARRISQAEFSQVYFRLDPAPVSWSRSELEEIIELGPESGLAAVEERVQRFSEKDSAHLRRLFLGFLTGSFAERTLFNADWFYNLMAWSPAYITNRERRPSDFFEDDGFMPLVRLLFQALKRSTPEERFFVVIERLDEINDLSVFTDFFRSTVGDTNPEGAAREREKQFFGERTHELREHLVDRVRDFAQSGKLWSQVSPSRLLWFWWGSNYEEEVRGFLSQAMRDPYGLRNVLDLVIGTVVSSSGNYERISHGYQRMVDFDALTAAAEDLLSRRLETEDGLLVSRYMQALKRAEGSSF